MENTIKNIHKIAPLLTESELERIEKGAALHKRHSNITFKILSVSDDTITLSVSQGKNSADIYQNGKQLIKIAKELFLPFLPNYQLNAGPVVYVANPISAIDAKWLNKRMKETGIRSKDIVADTGMDKANISAYINDQRPMGHPVKAMFYFYFQLKSQD